MFCPQRWLTSPHGTKYVRNSCIVTTQDHLDLSFNISYSAQYFTLYFKGSVCWGEMWCERVRGCKPAGTAAMKHRSCLCPTEQNQTSPVKMFVCRSDRRHDNREHTMRGRLYGGVCVCVCVCVLTDRWVFI